MNILLTASFDKGLFCNGLQQNIVFLAELIKDLGHNPIILLNHEIDDSIDPPANILLAEKDEMHDLGKIDYLLQTGWLMSHSDVDKLKQANSSCKNIHVHYGNRLLADVEQCKWENVPIAPYSVDEVWVSPHYEFSFSYFKTYYKTQKVFELPYIWSSRYVDAHERIWNKTGKSCKYDKNEPKNICILEPNLNMTKNCLPSIFIVEEAYRKNVDLINQCIVYCTDKVRDAKYFKLLMWELDITKNNKIIFDGRRRISHIFSHTSNVVVSHQLLNGLNYTYLEALHFNIPLVHNSEFIKEAGYYYPDYDTVKGGEALYEALTFHDKNLEEYEKTAQRVIFKYSPNNPTIKEKYRKLFV